MGRDVYAGLQSALDPRGIQAERIDDLWWLFLVLSTIVWIAVAAALGLALWRRNRQVLPERPQGEPRKVRVVAVATGITVVVLLVLIAYSAIVGRAITGTPDASRRPVIVNIVGHQWWWEIEYYDDVASRRFTTANELRIPVGRPVILQLTSRDVIHSFWVPNLHGKIDLIPGRTTTIWFEAEDAGEYRGQCAEFCGLQHAKMAFVVVAEPDDEFARWAERQRQPAAAPGTEIARAGEQVFLAEQCSLCHTIRGTGAWGRIAPDLTRIGSRRTLAAGTLRNTRGNLAGWIVDPQHVKPGSFMPPTNLAPGDLQALLAYLESLQ
jgi:cytochrome c oxidase subunit 2